LLLWHYRRNMPDWSKKEVQTVAKPIAIKKVVRPAVKAKKKSGKKK